MEDSTRQASLQEHQFVAALKSVSALEHLIDVLSAKVEEFDTRLCKAESQLENIFTERD